MARHLREQSGGDPRDQGPVPELAGRPGSSGGRDDFPDAPDHDERSGPGGDLTDEQLADFAARLGLTDESERDATRVGGAGGRGGDEPEPGGDGRRSRRRLVPSVLIRRVRLVRRPVGRLLVVVAHAADGTGSWLRMHGERLSADAPPARGR